MKNKLIAIVAAAIIAVAGVGGLAYVYNNNKTETKPAPTSQTVKQDKITFSNDKKTVSYTAVAGQTVLVTLESLTPIQTQDYSFGKVVTGINGVNAEKDKTYWALYVNDIYANEGAGTLKPNAGDKIKWQLTAL